MRWVGIRTLGAWAKAMLVAALAVAMVLPGQDAALSQTSGGPQVPLFTVIDLGDGSASGISGVQQVGENTVFDQARGGSFEHAMLWSGTAASTVDLNPNGFAISQANGTSGVQQVGWGIVSQFGPPLHHALLWRGTAGTVVDLGALLPPGFTFSEALGTDSSNDIVGFANGPASPAGARALIWKGTAGGVVDLTPPAATGGAVAAGIAGTQQVGYGYVPDPVRGFVTHALLWSGTASSAVDLHPTGFISSQATAIAGGQQVGTGFNLASRAYHALLWNGSPGSAVDLNPSGFTVSIAVAVAGGQQVGYGSGPATGGFQSHALLWRGSAASAVDLNAFLPAGYTNSRALGIDANGNIVGVAGGFGLPGHAFVWKPGVAVIILPGIEGSWTPAGEAFVDHPNANILSILGLLHELNAMMGSHLSPTQLVLTTEYDKLISTLKAQGVLPVVMPYDWANGGVKAAAHDLDSFIKGFGQVDIIAHSTGGLVAQQYILDRLAANQSPKVRNLVLLGTPNRGAVEAHCFVYASIRCVTRTRGIGDAGDLAFALFAQLGIISPASVETVGQLMPTFAYVVDASTGQFLRNLHPTSTCGNGCIFDNAFTSNLAAWTRGQLNSGALQAAGITVYAEQGTDLSTAAGVGVEPRSPTQVATVFRGSGDGTVLAASAALAARGVTNIAVPRASHASSVINCGATLYLSVVNGTPFACTVAPSVNKVIVIQTHSPVKVLLTDPSGRTTGFDYTSGRNVAGIPSSILLDGDSPGIFVSEGIKGTYQLDVVGVGAGGPFGLDIAYPNAFPTGFDSTVESFSQRIAPGERLRFLFETFAFQDVTSLFAAFNARLEVHPAARRFTMNGTFSLAPGGTISPQSQPMTIEIGDGFVATIPAGSFTQLRDGAFVFEGETRQKGSGGAAIEARMTPLGGNRYSFKIEGRAATNLPTVNPVEVRLAVGGTAGDTSVNAEFDR